jgi:hypothetical protein
VSPFRYWRDPLFLSCCGLYGLNRCCLKPYLHSVFLRSYFNDLLLIPCALPLLLWLHRRLRLRHHDAPPTFAEIAGHLAVWSVLFEAIGPRWLPGTTADLRDVLVYTVGGLAAFLIWRPAWRGAAGSLRP